MRPNSKLLTAFRRVSRMYNFLFVVENIRQVVPQHISIVATSNGIPALVQSVILIGHFHATDSPLHVSSNRIFLNQSEQVLTLTEPASNQISSSSQGDEMRCSDWPWWETCTDLWSSGANHIQARSRESMSLLVTSCIPLPPPPPSFCILLFGSKQPPSHHSSSFSLLPLSLPLVFSSVLD